MVSEVIENWNLDHDAERWSAEVYVVQMKVVVLEVSYSCPIDGSGLFSSKTRSTFTLPTRWFSGEGRDVCIDL